MRNHILFLIVVFLSNTIQAFTGFAGTMLAMPASMLLLGMERASAVLNVIAIVVSLLVLWKDHRYVQWKELLKIVLLMLAGMGVGIYLLNVVPTQILQYCYAGFIILIALKKIFIKREIRVPGLIMLLVIFAAGIIHGMFVSGGSLLVLYAVTVLKEKKDFRATMAMVWVFLNSMLLVSHIRGGYFDLEAVGLLAAAIPVTLLSVWLGNKLHDKIDQALFLKITYVLLLLSGLLLIL